MKMKKAIYIPTNTATVIIGEVSETHVKIFLNNEEKIVAYSDLKIEDEVRHASFHEIKKSLLYSLINKPVSDLIYTYNTSRLIPEHHQYKPLIKMLKSPNNRLLIADEVGLGKTIEAGMIYKEIDKRNEVDVALIVVPSSLTLKWRNEMLMRFNEEFEIYRVNEFKRFLQEYKSVFESDVSSTLTRKMIISYHTLRDEQVVKMLEETPLHIDVLIMDEAHTFRNRETSTFEGAEQVCSLAENILFLSATPVQNDIMDLFNILSLLDEDSFMDEGYFLESIRPNALLHQIIAKLKNQKPLEEIQAYIENYLMDTLSLNEYQEDIIAKFMKEELLEKEKRVMYIREFSDADNLSYIINRTKKKDVGLYIKREAQSQTIPPSEEEREFYRQVIEFIKLIFKYKNPKIPAGFITIMPERMASSSMIASIDSFKEMRRTKRFYIKDFDDLDSEVDETEIEDVLLDQLDVLIAAGEAIGDKDSKYQAFEEIVDRLQREKIKKMIVFSFFKKTLSYLENKLKEKGLRTGKIDGDMTPDERFEKIQEFKEGKFDILLSSEVGSEGLDMQFCNVVINYDMPWNPMRVEQRIGRIDRIGQQADKLLIFNLCIEGTIEDRIYSRLYEKLNIFENSIGELEPILGDLTKRLDIEKIIELSEEEMSLKVELEADAMIRKKQEISEQIVELDGMINDVYDYDKELNTYINDEKEHYIVESLKELFLGYLDQKGIGYTSLKNDIYKLNQEDAYKLVKVLKSNWDMDKKATTLYTIQKKAISKIKRAKPYRFTFRQQEGDFSIDVLSLTHPVIRMLSMDQSDTKYGAVINRSIKSVTHAVVYRQEITAQKKDETLHVLLYNSKTGEYEEVDYVTFFSNSSEGVFTQSIEVLKSIEDKVNLIIIRKIEKLVEKKKEETERLIEQKISGIKEHYKKRRVFAEKMKIKVTEENVRMMREQQIKNLIEEEKNKIDELQKQKKVNETYTILSVMEINNE
jgi:superfamily II DNA/RNA helicase